jgi:hypothetical protein
MPDNSKPQPEVAGASNPFRGLKPLKAGEPIFERDRDVSLIMSRFSSGRLTLLFAGSGVGKSSFLDAKLVPHLQGMFSDENVKVPPEWARNHPDVNLADVRRSITNMHAMRNGRQTTFVVILDQFEELFQHFPDEILLSKVGAHLSGMIQGVPLFEQVKETSASDLENDGSEDRASGEMDIRVMISVREEFLGELSLFDNFLTGLFVNYYRLRRITPEQARTIITRTAMLRRVHTSSKIDSLLVDLLKIRSRYDKLNVESKNALNNAKLESPAVKTLSVELPYLQIVCAQIWNREHPTEDTEFLKSYRNGEAEQVLEGYCHGVLNRVKFFDRFLLAKALAHLTGPHEAKQAIKLPDLAREMKERNTKRIGRILEQLCDKDVRILETWEEQRYGEREVSQPRRESIAAPSKKGIGETVFQLYHDMYSPLLWKWREQQLMLKQLLTAALIFFVVGLGVPGLLLSIKYLSIRHALHRANASVAELSDLRDFRNSLFSSIAGQPFANHVWREYHDRFATEKAMDGDTDAALLHRFAAIASATTTLSHEETSRLLGPAEYLQGTYLPSTKGFIFNDVAVLRAPPSSANSQTSTDKIDTVIGGTNDGKIVKWVTRGQNDPIRQVDFVPTQSGWSASVLCFSLHGEKALVAKIDSTGKLILMLGSTHSGAEKSSTQAIPIDSLKSPASQTRAAGIPVPSAASDKSKQQSFGSLYSYLLPGMKGALSSDGQLVAVLIDNDPYVSWVRGKDISEPTPLLSQTKGISESSPLPSQASENPIALAINVGTSPDGKYVVAVQSQSGLSDLQQGKLPKTYVDLWFLDADADHPRMPAIRLDEKKYTVPPLARLIFDSSGDLLVRLEQNTQASSVETNRANQISTWGWKSERKSSELHGKDSEPHDTFRLLSDLFPQVFAFEKDGSLLVSHDLQGGLSLTKLTQKSDKKWISSSVKLPNLGRLKNSQPATAPKVITASSSEGLLMNREFLEIDIDGSTIRRWRTPLLDSPDFADSTTPDSDIKFQKRDSKDEGVFISASGNVRLRVVGDAASYKPGSFMAPVSNITLDKWPKRLPYADPVRVVFDEERFQLLVLYREHLCLVAPREKDDPTPNCLDRPDISDAVFGPGPKHITFTGLNDDLSLVGVTSLSSPAEWNHKCESCKLLHSEDEDGVVVYSDSWLHRLTIPEVREMWPGQKFDDIHAWVDAHGKFASETSFDIDSNYHPPRITSVLAPIRILDFGGVSPAKPDGKDCIRNQHSLPVSSAKAVSNSCVKISGSKIIDFDGQSAALNEIESPRWWFNLLPTDFVFCGSAGPGTKKPNDANQNSLNILCEWEARSGRQLVPTYR